MTVNVSKAAINVREKLAELDKPSGIAGEAMLRAETPQEQFQLIGAGRRNILINGSHIVNQRNNLPTSGTSGGYPATDRWKYYSTTTSCSLSLSSVTLPDGTAANSLKAESTTSGTHAFDWYQKVEPINYAHLDGQTVTLSCWVRSNSLNARIMLWQSGGSLGQTPYTGNGEWQYLTVSGVVDASNASLEAYAAIGTEDNLSGVAVTSGEYVEFTRCQLELGKVATPFEHRSYGEELALCQRYYWSSYPTGYGAGSTGSGNSNTLYWVKDGNSSYATFGTITFPTQMRTTPTAAIYNPTTGAAGQFTSDGVNTTGVIYYVRNHSFAAGHSNVSVTSQTGINYHVTADAEL